MLESPPHHGGVLRAAEATFAYVVARPAIVREVEALREVLEDRRRARGAASVTRPSGRRWIESATDGWHYYLVVRTDPDAAFACLGPVAYVAHHADDRPIAITWKLETPMPADLFERYATLRPT